MQSPDDLLAVLEHNPAIIVPMVLEAPAAILKRRPAPDTWSIHELACHLANVHSMFTSRLDLMLSHEHPVITPYDPDTDEQFGPLLDMDLHRALDRYATDRAGLTARLRMLTPEQWQRTARHPEYNRYSIFIMFRHLALHDLAHAYEIETLMLKPDWEQANQPGSPG